MVCYYRTKKKINIEQLEYKQKTPESSSEPITTLWVAGARDLGLPPVSLVDAVEK